MSLMDSLLLDPFALDVWVAPRIDGVLGSGTEEDPYDGSVRATPIVAVDSITSSGTTATATTHINHGFQTNQLVRVFGVTDSDAKYYNGTFVITVVNSTTFSYVMAGSPVANVSDVSCQADPYFFDSVMRSLPMPVTITNSGTTATVTAIEHGLPNGSTVLVAGATGSYAPFNNGSFVITVFNYDVFQYTMIGAPPAGQVTGYLYCRLNQFEAAGRLYTGPPPLALHLGPGIFQTRGYTPAATPSSWIPRSAMKMLGSGMETTVLQLVDAVIDNTGNDYVAMSEPYDSYHDGFEAWDFTVDCNITGQPSQLVTCGGMGVAGTRNRFRRIRVINFGPQTNPAQIECFVLGISGVEVLPDGSGVAGVANLIQDCIVEQPGLNSTLETTGLYITSGEVGDFQIYHRGSTIRNCYINCEYRLNPVQILNITISAGVATVTTAFPHGHVSNDWVLISGVMVSGTIYNSFNGSYQITRLDDYRFSYTTNPTQSVSADPLSPMWVGKYPRQTVEITGLSVSNTGPPWVITITTATQHFLIPGRTVVMSKVPDNTGQDSTVLNGAFPVSSVIDPKNFTYQIPTGSKPTLGTLSVAFIGVSFQGGGTDNGTAAVLEGNRFINCLMATYHDTDNTKDQIIRNNYFRAIALGSYHNLDGSKVSTTSKALGLAITNNGSGFIAYATTSQAHGFVSGDKVLISGATNINNGQYYNSPAAGWTVTYMNATQFSYNMAEYGGSGTPTGPASGAEYATGPNPPNQQQRILAAANPVMGLYPLTFAQQGSVFVVTAAVDQSTWPNGHGLSVGEVVYISKASLPAYNGYFLVSGLTKYTFQYTISLNPGGSSTTGYYGRLWGGGKIINAGNVIDLLPSQTVFNSSRGVQLGYESGNFALFPQVVLRRNIIRHMDAVMDFGTYQTLGFVLFSCGALIAEENVIDLDLGTPSPIRFDSCPTAEFFANQTSAGTLIQGATPFDSPSSVNELSTNVEDAALLAF
jgi:hypothetical protein